MPISSLKACLLKRKIGTRLPRKVAMKIHTTLSVGMNLNTVWTTIRINRLSLKMLMMAKLVMKVRRSSLANKIHILKMPYSNSSSNRSQTMMMKRQKRMGIILYHSMRQEYQRVERKDKEVKSICTDNILSILCKHFISLRTT